jgi:hypothetical protein
MMRLPKPRVAFASPIAIEPVPLANPPDPIATASAAEADAPLPAAKPFTAAPVVVAPPIATESWPSAWVVVVLVAPKAVLPVAVA